MSLQGPTFPKGPPGCACSGGMKLTVPMIVPGAVSWTSLDWSFMSEKSMSTGTPPFLRQTFAGFMSRWMRLRWWM